MPFEAALFAFLIATAVVISRLKDLFAAAMLTGIFSLLSAGLFTVMDAVDVAFTEAAVGAGVATVLILGALSLTATTEDQRPFRILPLVVVLLTGAALVWGMADLHPYGDPTAVIHHYTVPRYIQQSGTEIGPPNIVTSVLASYRGFDTLGETSVIFTAALGVMLLLGGRRGAPSPTAPVRVGGDLGPVRMRDIAVLKAVTKAFLPIILLFALYVQFHGDFGPGGGFQAGVIFAAGFIVWGLIFGLDAIKRVVPPHTMELGIALGVLIYGGVGVVTMLMGGNYLDYNVFNPHHPAHGQELGILLVELGVGITVTCTMTLVFYKFAGRSQR